MAIFGFLKKDKNKKAKEEKVEGIIPPPPRPKIEEIPSFPFEKEELLPPIKPIKPEIKPLEEKTPAPDENELEEFTPKQTMPEKPKTGSKKIREHVVVEEPFFEREVFEREITPEPESIMPLRSAFLRQEEETRKSEDVPYVRFYKFKETAQDLNQIAKSLRRFPTRTRSQTVEEAYDIFGKSLDVFMKKLDSIERGIFE